MIDLSAAFPLSRTSRCSSAGAEYAQPVSINYPPSWVLEEAKDSEHRRRPQMPAWKT
jgi:hypothetical protein